MLFVGPASDSTSTVTISSSSSSSSSSSNIIMFIIIIIIISSSSSSIIRMPANASERQPASRLKLSKNSLRYLDT